MLNHSQIKKLYDKIKKTSEVDLLRKIVIPQGSSSPLIEVDNNVFMFESNMLIINRKKNFNDIGDEALKKMIIMNEAKKVFFYSIDIMLDFEEQGKEKNGIIKFYANQNQEQNVAVNILKNEIFKNFNNYRAHFFNTLRVDDDFKKLEKVPFILVLLPYWEVERAIPP